MTILGFDSLHWGGPAVREKVEAARDAGRPLLSNLDPRYDAFSDVLPLTKGYRLLDVQYPGSRFVLTVRPVDEWIDSRRRHVEMNQRKKAVGEYAGTFLVIDEEAWRAEWTEHTQSVRRYFAGRADYLEIDLAVGTTWGHLCGFLHMPEPAQPFPWVNRDRTAVMKRLDTR